MELQCYYMDNVDSEQLPQFSSDGFIIGNLPNTGRCTALRDPELAGASGYDVPVGRCRTWIERSKAPKRVTVSGTLGDLSRVAQNALVGTHDLRQPYRQVVAPPHVLANVGDQIAVVLPANDFFARRACDFLGHHNLISSGRLCCGPTTYTGTRLLSSNS